MMQVGDRLDSGDHGGVQVAIDVSSSGRRALVSPGSYPERFSFGGEAITVSGRGAGRCVIDPSSTMCPTAFGVEWAPWSSECRLLRPSCPDHIKQVFRV